jgi:uncharacterized protein with HEPN domain
MDSKMLPLAKGFFPLGKVLVEKAQPGLFRRFLSDYLVDDETRLATERALTIIGEALAQARQYFPEVLNDISQVPQIVGFRNRLIRAYLEIDDASVWQIVERSIPHLLGEARKTLSKIESSEV